MEKIQISIALQNAQAAEKIKYSLQRSGFYIGDICESGRETLRKVRSSRTDILIINFDLPDMTGLEVSTILGDENICSVILLVSSIQKEFCLQAAQDYDITLLVKPLSSSILLNTVEAVVQNRRRIGKLENELNKLKKELVDRKIIEKAKGILMKKKSISEAEAYRRIQTMSMDSRVAMRDIADKIIELAGKSFGDDIKV